MTEEIKQGQVPDESPQVGHSSGQEPQPTEGQEPEVDMAYVRQLRKEAAEYRKRLRELEEAERKRKEAEMSEVERLQARLAEYERQKAEWERSIQEVRLQAAVQAQAAKLGIVDPEAAYRLLDLASLEFDESGNPVGVEKALQTLLQEKPYLRGQAAPPIGPTNPARRGPQVFTRSQLRDPKFFREHKEEIMQALREGRILDE